MPSKQTLFRFHLIRSGDGKRYLVGRGTLARGKRLVEALEAEFARWEASDFKAKVKPAVRALEGSDIDAIPISGKGPSYTLDDEWVAF